MHLMERTHHRQVFILFVIPKYIDNDNDQRILKHLKKKLNQDLFKGFMKYQEGTVTLRYKIHNINS